MENVYRRAVQQIKQGDMISPLFPVDWAYKALKKVPKINPLETSKVVEKVEAKPVETPAKVEETSTTNLDQFIQDVGSALDEQPAQSQNEKPSSGVTEKARILDSLHKFGEEKIEASSEKVFRFSGGEMSFKKHGNEEATKAFSVQPLEVSALLENQSKMIGELADLREKIKPLSSLEKTQILFVTDSFLSEASSDSEELLELPLFFDPAVSTLFQKMIGAMKVAPTNYYVSAVNSSDGEKSLMDVLLQEIHFLKPQVIITLGAQATNELLQIDKRLKDIHGQFFQVCLRDDQTESRFELMPLFSPKLLNTAPSMKKTAWIDMQKAMEKLS